MIRLCCASGLLPAPQQRSYLCKRSRSDVKSTYSDTFRPVMSTRMSPVTTFMRGGLPPTPLGQEKPVPCMEQVHRTGSWRERGRTGEDVTGSEEQTDKVEEKLGRLMWQYLCRITVYVSHIIHSYIMQEMQLWLVFYMLQSIHHW